MLIQLLAVILPSLAVVIGHVIAARDRANKAHDNSAQNAEIHVLVNGRLAEALDRIKELEEKLGLSQGEAIPGPQIVSIETEGTGVSRSD